VLLIIGAVAVGIAIGLAFGGGLKPLAEAQFKWWPLAIVGLALQLVPVPSRPGEADHLLGVGLLVASYIVLLAFVALNLRYFGFWFVAAGFALNLLVITLNGGMPVDDHALRVAYGSEYQATLHSLVASGGAKHHLQRPSDVVTPLSDVIPVGRPVGNVFSVGDMVALFGVVLVMAGATKGPPGKHRVRRATRGWRAPQDAPARSERVRPSAAVGGAPP
jgi:hypothetical protein